MSSKHRTNNFTNLDLNINNYSLPDLYKLFHINPGEELTEEVIKKAKRIVLFTHPDKSGLPADYFRFFSKAFNLLSEIYQTHKHLKRNETLSKQKQVYTDDISTYNNEIHETIKEYKDSSISKFSKDFNARFEEVNREILPENDGRGYSDWMKTQDDPFENLENHKSMYEQRKNELREKYALINTTPTALGSIGGCSLWEDTQDFTSDTFSSSGGGLGFTDLKKSYTETIIPVGEEEFQNKQKYRSVDEYIQERQGLFSKGDPFKNIDHSNILRQQEREEAKMSEYRTYELAKQLEESKAKNQAFSRMFYKISN
jgi:hypothetical protein